MDVNLETRNGEQPERICRLSGDCIVVRNKSRVVIKGKKSGRRRRGWTTFIIGSCGPFAGEGSALSSCSRVEWKFMGRARNFSWARRRRVAAVSGPCVLPLPPPLNVSFNERPRPVWSGGGSSGGGGGCVSQCYQLYKVIGTPPLVPTTPSQYSPLFN